MVNMKNKNCCEKDCNCDCCDEGEKMPYHKCKNKKEKMKKAKKGKKK